MPCNGCTKDKPIVNKKYNFCSNCNSIRTTGSSLQERQAESALKYQQKALAKFRSRVTEDTDNECFKLSEKSLAKDWNNEDNSRWNNLYRNTSKQRTPVRKQTSKDAKVKSALSQLKRSIELEAVQNNEYYCKGCGQSKVGLDKSHLLSVGQFKHLELVKENIQLLCRTCHQVWENQNIQDQLKLHCFIENVVFIYFYDTTSYNKFITRLESHKVFLLDDEKSQVDSILEKIQEGIDLGR